MTDNDTEPALRKMGANTRDAPSGYNLDVSGTVGPDYMGQETVDVDGHPNDRPGVRWRLPETSGGDDPRISRMDTGEELPVLLSSSMSADPCEGTQGSYTQIVEGTCARCGYDRLQVAVHTLAGETQETCNACGAKQDHRAENGYRMPDTDKERAADERRVGESLGELLTRGVYDLEDSTGVGPYVSLVGSHGYTRLRKDDVADLFFMLVDNDDVDLTDEIRERNRELQVATIAVALLPDTLTVCKAEDDDTE